MEERLIRDLAFAGAGVIVGGGLGYFIAQKTLKTKYQRIADAEIEQVKDRFKLLRKEDEFETAEGALEKLHDEPKTVVNNFYNKTDVLTEEEAKAFTEDGKEYAEHLTEQGYTQESATEILEAVHDRTTLRVFETDQPTPEELEPDALHGERRKGRPYVISLSEFMADNDFEKLSLNYFEADQTLCTDDEEIVPDIAHTVGVANMRRFGQGSDDPATVYVRNEDANTDYEVVLDERGYAEIVLGQKPSPS